MKQIDRADSGIRTYADRVKKETETGRQNGIDTDTDRQRDIKKDRLRDSDTGNIRKRVEDGEMKVLKMRTEM